MNTQIRSPFPSSLIILNLFILIVTTRSESSLHESHDSCAASFTCGTISGIRYPFSRLEYPQYCGYPGLELNCVGKSSPSIDINNMTYHVLSINQTSQLLKIVREDVIESVCPHEFVNTTIDHELFNQTSSYTNITFLYGCEENLNNLYSLSCDDNGIDRVLVSYGEQGPVSCNRSVIIPVPDPAIRSVNSTGLGQILRGGFEVRWKVDMEACNECTQSSGLCRYDHDTRRTSCTTARIGSSTKTRSLTIVLPIAVAILVATGIGSGLFLYRKRRKTRSIRSHEAPINHVAATGLDQRSLATNFPACIIKTSSTTTQLGNSSYFGTRVFTYEELESATDGFNDSQELGDGGFGTVYYGKLPDGQEIAVKRLHKHSFKRVEQFTNEVEILTMLRHKNLVKLYGCTSRRSRELLLVYEYIPNGTLADHLHGKLANPGWLDWSMRVNIAIETAEALTYLHESDIIHRDVKTSNILLDDNYGVKVADFGLSRLFPGDVTHVSTAPQGTPGYVDPEYYQCYRLTEKSDVYSFGVVLMELISSLMAVDTGRDRFEVNLANMAVDKIQNGRLGELVDRRIGFECGGFVRRTVSLVAELGFRCLLPEKEMRPAMAEVVESLRGIWKEGVNAQSPEVVDVVADDGGGPPLLESGAAGDLV